MRVDSESRSDRKRRTIVDVATKVFLDNGFDCATMDDVAQLAAVSKPTLYRYFNDKEHLFAEVVRSTTREIDEVVRLVADTLADNPDAQEGLVRLACRMFESLLDPQLISLRRLVIANAGRFPDVGREWYEQGFQRVLNTLSKCFERLAERKQLRLSDPLLAANHFVGLLLWIPLNNAMFTGRVPVTTRRTIEDQARAAVRVFFDGYGTRAGA
jgi:TetR/AcrR family transcriptional repressor of mexJK operon